VSLIKLTKKGLIKMLYIIMTEDGLDQVVETKELASKEVKELRAMDIGKVWIKQVNSWLELDQFEAKLNS
jgi:hypothetical protein